ncbi:hypothetical protein BC351_39500 [Paenibacillus ferrarius]|uniref:Major facilitator superfamily (MFS) profile domain-containing protein n=1 Tax=Paenibacillus ferrarius TaxID=1469647 RepID=A0A1V4H9D3_9BACL|nr:hypothetical protein [Paenibacillus ferrarius]OPH47812.1 hypothetical protein BC351_39500 [Paenibacillus ferrarius]
MMSATARSRMMVITCITLFMAMLDNLVIGVALPAIQSSLQASMSNLRRFLNAYTLAFEVLLISFRTLRERFCRKRMLLTGVVFFTLGSLDSADIGPPLFGLFFGMVRGNEEGTPMAVRARGSEPACSQSCSSSYFGIGNHMLLGLFIQAMA